jgi:nucleoside-diphosphate-sugar epimerase
VTVANLAKIIIEAFMDYPEYRERAEQAEVVTVSSMEYFGKYYQDIHTRVPSVAAARVALGWEPKIDLRTAIRLTLDYHLRQQHHDLTAESAAS